MMEAKLAIIAKVSSSYYFKDVEAEDIDPARAKATFIANAAIKSSNAHKVKNIFLLKKTIAVNVEKRRGQGLGHATDSIITNPGMTSETTAKGKSGAPSAVLGLKEMVSFLKMEFTLLVCLNLW